VKKPLLATLGLAGACVACCTIPLAIPLFGGAAALGLTSWLGVNSKIGMELLVGMTIVSIAGLAWGAIAWSRRSRAKDCGTEASSGSACAVGPDDKGCGCAASSKVPTGT
jgi:hypothetical protein